MDSFQIRLKHSRNERILRSAREIFLTIAGICLLVLLLSVIGTRELSPAGFTCFIVFNAAAVLAAIAEMARNHQERAWHANL